jgi:hypothetical protein
MTPLKRQALRVAELAPKEGASPKLLRETERLGELAAPRRRSAKALPFPSRKTEKAARKDARRLATRAVYEAVRERAAGKCEACGRARHQPIMDHWLGGSGRRKQLESVETCWGLCGMCNRQRTDNSPNAAYWNDIRRVFCVRYGYPFVPHIEHARLPR